MKAKIRLVFALTALAGGSFVWILTDRAVHAPARVEPPALPEPAQRCAEPSEHAAHGARLAERYARERAEVYALVPDAGLGAREHYAQAQACAELAGDPALSARIATARAAFDARFARDYARHAERYRLACRAGRCADAAADVAYLEAIWRSSHLASHARRAAFLEQLRNDAPKSAQVPS